MKFELLRGLESPLNVRFQQCDRVFIDHLSIMMCVLIQFWMNTIMIWKNGWTDN